MPLYEYQCAKDGRFELIRRFSDPPLKKCPTCGGKVEKLASAPAIQFKGTGWYVTDYAKKSGGDGKAKNGDTKAADATAKSEPSSKTESSSKAESKSDSAPTKPPSKDGSASGSSQTSKASS